MEMEPKAFKALYKYSALYQPNISTASLKTTGANPSAPAPSGQHIVYGWRLIYSAFNDPRRVPVESSGSFSLIWHQVLQGTTLLS